MACNSRSRALLMTNESVPKTRFDGQSTARLPRHPIPKYHWSPSTRRSIKEECASWPYNAMSSMSMRFCAYACLHNSKSTKGSV
eukprot:3390449-Pyramimonas_sp.AAC.1